MSFDPAVVPAAAAAKAKEFYNQQKYAHRGKDTQKDDGEYPTGELIVVFVIIGQCGRLPNGIGRSARRCGAEMEKVIRFGRSHGSKNLFPAPSKGSQSRAFQLFCSYYIINREKGG